MPVQLNRSRMPVIIAGLIFTASGWTVLWTTQTFWNPLAFTTLWTGAALLMWEASEGGYPGIRRHALLALLSVPLWWWFELVNTRTENWQYIHPFEYEPLQYAVLSSAAFATVAPVLVAATSFITTLTSRTSQPATKPSSSFAWWEIALGAVMQAGVFIFPAQLYPLVWVAPFLVIDGLLARVGGRSLAADLMRGKWRAAVTIGLAGLLCGMLWEFWNYWSTPKWIYHVPLLGFAKVFEMPLLGYGGYMPFAWSIMQFVRLLDTLKDRVKEGI